MQKLTRSGPQPMGQRIFLIVIPILLFLLAQWNFLASSLWIRFTRPVLNHVFFLYSLTLPWVTLIVVRILFAKRTTKVAFFAISPVLLYTLFWGFWGMMELESILEWNGVDKSMDLVNTVNFGAYRVGIYRTDGGATTSFGVAVQQEKPLPFGLVIIRPIDFFYPAVDPTCQIVGANSLRVSVPPYLDRAPARSEVYRLKPSFF